MNEKLKKFLDDAKVFEAKEREERKQKTLIELGLYEKVFSPNNQRSEEFNCESWDETNQEYKYFKKVPIVISDEEFQEVEKYSREEVLIQNNIVATALTIIAWVIFVGGFFAGIILGTVEVEGRYSTSVEFSFATAFIYWCVSLISGTVFLGFAEIIKLLNAIKEKLRS